MRNLLIAILTLIFTSQQNYPQSIKNDEWDYEIKFVSSKTLNIFKETSTDSEIVGSYTYLQKVIAIIDHRLSNNPNWILIVYPLRGFVEEKYLISLHKKQEMFGKAESDNSDFWQIELLQSQKEIAFIKGEPTLQSKTVGLLKKGDAALIIKDKHFANQAWLKCIFPLDGFIYWNDLLNERSDFVIYIGGSYGIKEIPYEKNLTNFRSPYGGFLEFGKMNWRPSLRIGYNHTESKLSYHQLKTDNIYGIICYDVFSLFNKSLQIYGLAGCNYWSSSFQNIKYPSLTSYFPLEKQSGFGYLVGGGTIYHIYNFFIDVHYTYLGTKMAVFGKESMPGEFTNQYKLYPGANQINITVGYRFIL